MSGFAAFSEIDKIEKQKQKLLRAETRRLEAIEKAKINAEKMMNGETKLFTQGQSWADITDSEDELMRAEQLSESDEDEDQEESEIEESESEIESEDEQGKVEPSESSENVTAKKKKSAKPKQLSKAELKAQKAKEEEDIDAIFAEMGLEDSAQATKTEGSKSSKKAKKKAAQKAKAAAAEADATTCDDLSKNSSESTVTGESSVSPQKPKGESTIDTDKSPSPALDPAAILEAKRKLAAAKAGKKPSKGKSVAAAALEEAKKRKKAKAKGATKHYDR